MIFGGMDIKGSIVDGEISDTAAVKSGVLQGSVLGPLLLLLLSTHSSLIIGGSPLLLSDGGSPPASPASHLAGLLRRRDPSTNLKKTVETGPHCGGQEE